MSRLLEDLSDVHPSRLSTCAVDAVSMHKRQWRRANRRPPALTVREALRLARFDLLHVAVAGANVEVGIALTKQDLVALGLAVQRVLALFDEALGMEA